MLRKTFGKKIDKSAKNVYSTLLIMGKELAQNHFHDIESDCATISLHALLTHAPQSESIQALFHNAISLTDIMKILSLEYKTHGIMTAHMSIEETEDPRPSRFFKQFYHQLLHGPYLGDFIGGLMLTKSRVGIRHVIAISNIHETDNPKATIVDSAPLHEQPLVRKVPLEYLDRRIVQEDTLSSRAIAIVGKPYDITIDYFDPDESLQHWEYIQSYDLDSLYRQDLLARAKIRSEITLSR